MCATPSRQYRQGLTRHVAYGLEALLQSRHDSHLLPGGMGIFSLCPSHVEEHHSPAVHSQHPCYFEIKKSFKIWLYIYLT